MEYKNIDALELKVGKGTIIDEKAVIKGINGPAKKIIIGDNCYIGPDVQVICDHFEIGDYSKLQHHVNIHGYKPCIIGHNAWIGQYTIIDSIGGVNIGNNCGVGAHSQLWSHIKYGDTLEGCRFLSDSPLIVKDDVWFVGHCIVSPIVAHSKSMAMVGSVITKDMDENQIYAGSPAKSISDKIGNQFINVTVEEKFHKMSQYLNEANLPNIKIVKNIADFDTQDAISYFDVDTRTYTKKGTPSEIAFMKFLLPEKAKFVPYEQ